MDWLTLQLERLNASAASLSPGQVLALLRRVTEFVSSPEGPAVRLGGARVGLGLTRDLRSRDPAGWVRFDDRGLTVAQARSILLGGPLAHLLLGIAMVLCSSVSAFGLVRWLLLLDGVRNVIWALRSLDPRVPGSDGAQLRRLTGLDGAAPLVAATDPNAGTSFGPPGA